MANNLFVEVESFIKSERYGWCTVERAQALAAAVVTLRPSISIIVGIWSGRDMLSMALAHKSIGKGKVIGIDPWFAKVSVQGQIGDHITFWGNQVNHEEAYKEFMLNRNHLGLTDHAEAFRMPSDEFNPMDAGIIVIDGNHGPQAAIDAERYAPKVLMGGLLYLDDRQRPRASPSYSL